MATAGLLLDGEHGRVGNRGLPLMDGLHGAHGDDLFFPLVDRLHGAHGDGGGLFFGRGSGHRFHGAHKEGWFFDDLLAPLAPLARGGAPGDWLLATAERIFDVRVRAAATTARALSRSVVPGTCFAPGGFG